MRDRAPRDEHACQHEDRAFGESGQVLRLAVAVLMGHVRGPHGDADREERQQSRDQIRTGVERLRDEAQGCETPGPRRA